MLTISAKDYRKSNRIEIRYLISILLLLYFYRVHPTCVNPYVLR